VSAVTSDLADGSAPRSARARRGQTGLGWLWILRRCAFGVLVVFGCSLLIFLALHALPSDPAQAILGKDASPQALAHLRQFLGLNRPVVTQYLSWLGDLLGGDLGRDYATQQPVATELGPALYASGCLLLATAVIAIPLSILLGAAAALRRDRLLDRGTLAVSLILTAVPEFVIGILLVMLLATVVFRVLPSIAILPSGSSPFAHPRQLVLPVLTLVLAVVPYLYRLVRGTMIDVLESEYITMARLKGLPERRVVLRHALPNALIPVTQASAIIMSYLLGGIVVVEYVFNYPGIGTLLTQAIANRDIPMIEIVSIVLTAGVVLFNLAADVLTVLLTPKLRTAGRS
jgi:peptide/nickel transport system permease protein